ncbi:hypothetical protein X975_08424, partial [Stegodyphus mimosarum]
MSNTAEGIDNAGNCLNKPKATAIEPQEIEALLCQISELRNTIAEVQSAPISRETVKIRRSLQEQLKNYETCLQTTMPKKAIDQILGLQPPVENFKPQDWTTVKRSKRSRHDSGSSTDSQSISTSRYSSLNNEENLDDHMEDDSIKPPDDKKKTVQT